MMCPQSLYNNTADEYRVAKSWFRGTKDVNRGEVVEGLVYVFSVIIFSYIICLIRLEQALHSQIIISLV